MVDKTLKLTKITFLLHVIVGSILAVLFWMPTELGTLFSWSINSTASAFSQIIAALFTGLVVSSLFGCIAKEWKQVKIYVIFEIVWLLAGLIVVILNFEILGDNAILFLLLIILFIALFIVSFLRQEEIIGIIIRK